MDQSNCTHEQHLSSLGMVKSLGEEGDCFRILLNRILHHAFSDQFTVQGVAVIRIAFNCLFVDGYGWLQLFSHEVGVSQVYVYVLQQFLWLAITIFIFFHLALSYFNGLLQLLTTIAVLSLDQITDTLNKHLPRLEPLLLNIQLLYPIDLMFSLIEISTLHCHLQNVLQCICCHFCIFWIGYAGLKIYWCFLAASQFGTCLTQVEIQLGAFDSLWHQCQQPSFSIMVLLLVYQNPSFPNSSQIHIFPIPSNNCIVMFKGLFDPTLHPIAIPQKQKCQLVGCIQF